MTTLRELTSHKVNPCNDRLTILAVDDPGVGGANHIYEISGFQSMSHAQGVILEFQNGPINEAGVNGITHEALLAILIDRLEAFQKGPFPDENNNYAINYLKSAVACLKTRTLIRMQRKIEGFLTN